MLTIAIHRMNHHLFRHRLFQSDPIGSVNRIFVKIIGHFEWNIDFRVPHLNFTLKSQSMSRELSFLVASQSVTKTYKSILYFKMAFGVYIAISVRRKFTKLKMSGKCSVARQVERATSYRIKRWWRNKIFHRFLNWS